MFSGLVFGLGDFLPGGVLKELGVDFVGGKLDVADDGASDEAALDREHVRILLGVGDADVGQLQRCEKIRRTLRQARAIKQAPPLYRRSLDPE